MTMCSTILYILVGQVFFSHSQELSKTSQWSVRMPEGQAQSGHCLIASGNFSLVVLESSEVNKVEEQVNRTWVVPEIATAKVCLVLAVQFINILTRESVMTN